MFTTLAPLLTLPCCACFGAKLLATRVSVIFRAEPYGTAGDASLAPLSSAHHHHTHTAAAFESAASHWPALRHRVVFSLYAGQARVALLRLSSSVTSFL